jgi:S-formylglutathione hydrolase FrmB
LRYVPRFSRRHFIVGGTALVAGGLGVGVGADIALSRGRGRRVVASAILDSVAMHGPVRWRLISPPATNGAALPIVLCLHGRNNDERYATDVIHLPETVVAVGAALHVASVAGASASYWHRRSSGIDPEAMVLNELLPLLFTRTGRAPVGLLGWSMGGYGALLLGGRHPDVFRAVAAASPALWPRYSASAPGAFDSKQDFDANDVFAMTSRLQRLSLRVDCGRDDPFVTATRRLRAALPNAEGSIGAGAHDASYWRSVGPDQVRFLAKALS